MAVNFSVNTNASDVIKQHNEELATQTVVKKKTQFDLKNYLNVRLGQTEQTKQLIIRLLPFSTEGGTPFKKVFVHPIKVDKAVSSNGWKIFVCPTHNKLGDKCPFCDVANEARRERFATIDEKEKKNCGDVEFMNKAKEYWIVRCIERGHEDDGVKFWLFPSTKNKKGVYDQLYNLFETRKTAAERRGETYDIFNLNDGQDLVITLSRTSDGKTSIQVVDEGVRSPLSDNYEQGLSWIQDPRQWTDVYTVKPLEYMEIISRKGVPEYDKEKQCYVDKSETSDEDKTESTPQNDTIDTKFTSVAEVKDDLPF